MSTDIWAAVGTTIATFVFLVIPVLVYAYYVLEIWIDDRASYERVIAAVEGGGKRAPSVGSST